MDGRTDTRTDWKEGRHTRTWPPIGPRPRRPDAVLRQKLDFPRHRPATESEQTGGGVWTLATRGLTTISANLDMWFVSDLVTHSYEDCRRMASGFRLKNLRLDIYAVMGSGFSDIPDT